MQGLVEEVRPGQLVSSTQGRDVERYYLVVSTSGNSFVNVTDGEYRGIEKPKRKNLKHLKIYQMYSEVIATKLAAQVKLTNAEIMSELAILIRKLQE
ncbi:KOW domain-containing RNA-binding protein [Desulfotomaculum sp. 1211_IL3151]|uniref:KOW domain-containing RNA-binding protein n=1 Tax=Desulfotomaculum sp. 1211_IL3151 TaxID=3084055 RepID=UPI002FD9FD7A